MKKRRLSSFAGILLSIFWFSIFCGLGFFIYIPFGGWLWVISGTIWAIKIFRNGLVNDFMMGSWPLFLKKGGRFVGYATGGFIAMIGIAAIAYPIFLLAAKIFFMKVAAESDDPVL